MKNRILLVILATISLGILDSCRQNNNNLNLEDLKLGFYKSDLEFIECRLNEDFTPDSLSYTANVEKSYTASVYLTPVLAPDSKGLIKINGTEAKAGEPFKTELKPGENIIDITLSEQRGASKTYKLTITQEDLSTVYVSEQLAPGIWRIDDFGGAHGNENMYLFEGKDKALLFDTGMGTGDLAGFIKSLTGLPVEVAITHGHRDHFLQVDQFKENTVYMSKKDESRLPAELITPKFKWIEEGDVIDIGAGKRFEIVEIPGHSLGCLIFLDSKNKYAVVGDGISSGSMVYMFSPTCTSVTEYLAGLKKVEEKLKDLDGLTLLVGHHYQEKVPLTGTSGKQLISDMRIVSEKVLSGEIAGDTAYTERNGEKTELRQAYYGLAGLWYNPKNLGTTADIK